MNTEASQENISKTTGERLRQAREQLGLSQQAVAERLCLKVSTVRDIEENTAPPGLASTFLRGYIRSYAKLVHIPEEELLPLMAKQAPVRAAKVAPMQSFSLGKSRKKRDGWLMGFTWLVVFVVIGLTGAWWWQNHQAQQQEIATMADQSSAQLSQGDGQAIPLGNSDDAAAADSSSDTTGTPPDSQAANTAAQPAPVTPDATANAPAAQTPAPAVVAPSQAPVAAPVTTPATAPAAAPADAGAIVMNFNADCWLQVNDATGKTLFSGIQKSGGTLNLNGTAPFKLKIGAPRAVQIQYQGKPVDLSQFIKSNRVARLTLAAE